MNPIQSIEIELAACRKAWADNPKATWAWCCHHMEHREPLIEPAENRIAYILSDKPKKEQAVRLRNFRPMRVKLPKEVVKALEACDKAEKAYDKAWEAWDKAREAYDKAGKACGKAREAYDKARETWDKARETWLKAVEAYYKALEAHKSQLIALHNKDWPDNTWNGKSILA